jgi:hypothetical protein
VKKLFLYVSRHTDTKHAVNAFLLASLTLAAWGFPRNSQVMEYEISVQVVNPYCFNVELNSTVLHGVTRPMSSSNRHVTLPSLALFSLNAFCPVAVLNSED